MQKENTKSVLIPLLGMVISSLLLTACMSSAKTEQFNDESLETGIKTGYEDRYSDELGKRGIVHIHCKSVNALHRCDIYRKNGKPVKIFDKGPVFEKYKEVSINDSSNFEVLVKLSEPPQGPDLPYMRSFAAGLNNLLKEYDSQIEKKGGGK